MAPLQGSPEGRWLSIEEVRVVSDLRIMHAKVAELYDLVKTLRQRYTEGEIDDYSDPLLLSENIDRIDEIYLWFVRLREERDRNTGTGR